MKKIAHLISSTDGRSVGTLEVPTIGVLLWSGAFDVLDVLLFSSLHQVDLVSGGLFRSTPPSSSYEVCCSNIPSGNLCFISTI